MSRVRDPRVVRPASMSASLTVSVNDPNRAVAASTAVAIAMPLVMALVVLPTASREVRIAAPSPSMPSPDISAIPWALSLTGPKVSMDTITPTVVSSPVPARATAKSATVVLPDPSRYAPKTAALMSSAEYTADSSPTPIPERMLVAGPVVDAFTMS